MDKELDLDHALCSDNVILVLSFISFLAFVKCNKTANMPSLS